MRFLSSGRYPIPLRLPLWKLRYSSREGKAWWSYRASRAISLCETSDYVHLTDRQKLDCDPACSHSGQSQPRGTPFPLMHRCVASTPTQCADGESGRAKPVFGAPVEESMDDVRPMYTFIGKSRVSRTRDLRFCCPDTRRVAEKSCIGRTSSKRVPRTPEITYVLSDNPSFWWVSSARERCGCRFASILVLSRIP